MSDNHRPPLQQDLMKRMFSTLCALVTEHGTKKLDGGHRYTVGQARKILTTDWLFNIEVDEEQDLIILDVKAMDWKVAIQRVGELDEKAQGVFQRSIVEMFKKRIEAKDFSQHLWATIMQTNFDAPTTLEHVDEITEEDLREGGAE